MKVAFFFQGSLESPLRTVWFGRVGKTIQSSRTGARALIT